MELQPASLAQVKVGRDGAIHVIESDLHDIAKQVKEIDPNLSVHWRDSGEHYAVVETLPNGDERLVTTCLELDQRLPEKLRRLKSPDYDFGKEVDRLDAKAERDKQHAFAEEVGERGEQLAHALRKDLEVKSRVYIPCDWKVKDGDAA